MNKDLRTFLSAAQAAGSDFYVSVKRPIEPRFESWVLQEKLAREGRFPAIFFHQVVGSDVPLVSNLFGSWALFGLALGLEPKHTSIQDILRVYRARQAHPIPFTQIADTCAPIQERVLCNGDVDLGLLPIVQHAPLDSGKYITCGQLVCRDPDTGILNVGIYRMEVKDRNHLGVMILPAQHANYILRRYGDLSQPMEAAVFIGHHPLVAVGTEYTGDIAVCEYDVAGGYMEEPLEVVQAKTVQIPVPAYAEICIEGAIDPTHLETDGPFAEWTGYYGERSECFILEVSGMTLRKDAIYHDLAAGCWEHPMLNTLAFTGAAFEAVSRVVPSVKHVYLPPSGRGVITAYISISKQIEGEGLRAGLAAVNSAPSVTFAVVVDDDVDVYNEEDVMWAVATRVCADRDIQILPNVAGGKLIPTAYNEKRDGRGTMTSKMVIDATKPLGTRFPTRIAPPKDLWERMRVSEYIE